ncbi:SMP-30/gluconolactonase/LRE family protein [Phenylobacterium sp.]|uniref:SMP-30/gluconolactonase/LRE family protein n=1 Tax=Phenylobacterium sp. TaxID=1871053 RepID=UPI00273164C9|nr:SMP-30/gluconolactonase/LRE family protein [Phenylobacterium sp.]MDP1616109.1 SMP-30/gluconolactonase/LRE family protein [Phenylobacterium sp.]MDP1988087.1 SMP-30/gluconolactonase/LRE family protein [Phenylobacterium sp.]
MDIELVCEGLEFPEGPIAMADGSVVLTEIKAQRLSRITPDGRRETLVETGGGPNGAAIGPDGAIYITNNGGSFTWPQQDGLTIPGPTPPSHKGGMIQRYDLKTGELTTLYESCDGRPFVGPNDLVFDRQGGFWFSDHGCSTPEGRKYGALYYAKADGSHVTRLRDHLISPNGVGLSPDEDVVYLADTQLGRLWAFDIEAPGLLKAQAGFGPGRVVANLPGYQLLDSLAVEAGGKVCVATIINGGVTAFDPSGETEHFEVPDMIVTNICFGGADMRDAWITASSTGRLYKARWPRPGLKLNYNA